MDFFIPENLRDQYQPFELGRWSGWVDKTFYNTIYRTLDNDPIDLFEMPGARLIKDSRNRLAQLQLSVDGEAQTVWLKFFLSRGLFNRIQHFIRPGKTRRGWTNAFRLLERGIATPRPLLGIERRSLLFRRSEGLLVVEGIDDAVQFRQEFRSLGKQAELTGNQAEKRAFLTDFARYVRRLHEAGISHRDLSGGNVLIREAPDGKRSFFLIDVNRARIRNRLTRADRIYDLERINIEPDEESLFFKDYATDDMSLSDAFAPYRKCRSRYRLMQSTPSRFKHMLFKLWYYRRVLWPF